MSRSTSGATRRPAALVSPPSATNLRRLALGRQGLLGRHPIGAGASGLLRTLERLAYVQIDTISVVARAHAHTAWLRTGNFEDRHFNDLVRRKRAFEYWYHAASYLPMRDYRFARVRMQRFKTGRTRVRSTEKKLLGYVADRIRAEGPLLARDFESPPRQSRGWWDWKPAKRALEQLFMQGDLMIEGRDGFAKRYELTERHLPATVDVREPSLLEYAQHLLTNGLRANGFATEESFLHGRRGHGPSLRAAMREALDSGLESDELVAFEHADQIYYARVKDLNHRFRAPAIVRILSPFDNAVILRDRCRSIFDFDFVLECYVPEKKRRWGYFSLPILYGDRFVGRMDCKARREDRQFTIRALYIEAEVDDDFFDQFDRAARAYARFTGCTDVVLEVARPAKFAKSLLRRKTRPSRL